MQLPEKGRLRAIFAALIVIFGISVVQAQEAGSTIYVDTLLNLPGTQWSGNERYVTLRAMMNGVLYNRSVTTNVSRNDDPGRQYSTLTIELNAKCDRFQATVGREDTRQLRGPGYCVFEVYGDGQRLFRSEAIRSNLTPVRVDSIGVKRNAPQEVDVSVRGVRTLQLKTRYASEFSQQARFVDRAEGCVWGQARLTLTGSDVSGEFTEGPIRDALRSAAIRVTSAFPALSKEAKPLRLGIAGLRLPKNGEPGAGRGDAEEKLRALVADTVFGMHRDGKASVAPLPAADAKALGAALSGESAARDNAQAALAIARGFHADLLLFGAMAAKPNGGKVTMRLIDVKTGKTLSEVVTPMTAGS